MLKRIFLFLLTNLMVIATISIVLNLLGIRGYLTAQGIDYQSLLIFCTVWGMGGAFISLMMSKFIAKRGMNIQMIDPNTASGNERELLNIIYGLAQKAGLPKMPEVGIYNSLELNAFATGPSKSNSLVAVSSGLLQAMNRDEIEGVLGHEISHVANGDMVTMTLIQGVINAFVMFLSRVLAYVISVGLSRNQERSEGFSSGLYFLMTFVFDILFTILGSIVVARFSRYREYRADSGGAEIAGQFKMINALKKLKAYYETPEDNRSPALAALKINHKSGMFALFSTHPSLDDRIARLENQVISR
jgi:heat shock protein HtpX